MPLTNTQYASIMRLYDDIKTANRRMQSDRYNEVTALCPDIANIDSEIIDLSVKTARARIEADSSDTNTDELTSSLKSLNERKVFPTPVCPINKRLENVLSKLSTKS